MASRGPLCFPPLAGTHPLQLLFWICSPLPLMPPPCSPMWRVRGVRPYPEALSCTQTRACGGVCMQRPRQRPGRARSSNRPCLQPVILLQRPANRSPCVPLQSSGQWNPPPASAALDTPAQLKARAQGRAPPPPPCKLVPLRAPAQLSQGRAPPPPPCKVPPLRAPAKLRPGAGRRAPPAPSPPGAGSAA